MARQPKPWWRKDRKCWSVTINGSRHNLGADRKAAFEQFHQLMGKPAQKRQSSQSVSVLMDGFLDWTSRHRSVRTFEWYQERCQSFLDTVGDLSLVQLKPLHVQEWLDKHPKWSDGHRRGCIVAVQRAMRWSQRMGYIETNPITYIEKPKAGKRDRIITREEYENILKHVKDREFQDLITVAWEVGCRPQELLLVEARHVDYENARWVFAPREAKVKSHPRIVYLTDTAIAITRRLTLKNPTGMLFRNADGRPWTRHAVNCRFGRLKKQLGVKYCLYLFRHSFATRLLEAGVDSLTVAILLGHTNPGMLSTVYQHLGHNPKLLMEQVKKAV